MNDQTTKPGPLKLPPSRNPEHGAVVTKDVPSAATVLGNPARPR